MILHSFLLEPRVGIEPTTFPLPRERSTTELPRQAGQVNPSWLLYQNIKSEEETHIPLLLSSQLEVAGIPEF